MDRYIPYDDVIYRLRGYVIADLEEGTALRSLKVS